MGECLHSKPILCPSFRESLHVVRQSITSNIFKNRVYFKITVPFPMDLGPKVQIFTHARNASGYRLQSVCFHTQYYTPHGNVFISIVLLQLIEMVMPQALLEKSVGKRVSLLLKDGRVLEGRLEGFDEYMNMVLEETTEVIVGGETRRLGAVILRGSNVVSISVS